MHATEPCLFDPDKSLWPSLNPSVVDPDGRLLDLEFPLDHELIDCFVGQMCQFEDETSDLWWDSLHNVLIALGLHRYIHSDVEPPEAESAEAVERWHRERTVVCELLAGTADTLLLDLGIEAGYDASNPKFANPFHLCELLRRQMGPSLVSARQIHQHVQALRPDLFEDVSAFLHELDRLYMRLDYHGVGKENPVWIWHCLDALDRADPQWRRKLAVLETTRERQRNNRTHRKTAFLGRALPGAGPAANSSQTLAAASFNGEESKAELADHRWDTFDSWDDFMAELEPKTRKLKLSGPTQKKTRNGMASDGALPVEGALAGHGQGATGRENTTARAEIDKTSKKGTADNRNGFGAVKRESSRGGRAPREKTDRKTPAQGRTKENKGRLPRRDRKTTPAVPPFPDSLPELSRDPMEEFYDVMADLHLVDGLVADCDLGDDDEDKDDAGGGYLGPGGSVASRRQDACVVINGEPRRRIPGYAAPKRKDSSLRTASKQIQQAFFRSKFPGRPPCATCACQHPFENYAYCAVCDFCHGGGPAECWATNPRLRGTRPLRRTDQRASNDRF